MTSELPLFQTAVTGDQVGSSRVAAFHPARGFLWLYGMLAAMFLVQFAFIAGAEEFEVRGNVSFERFDNDKSPHRVVRRFSFEVREGGWLLTTVPEQISSNAVFVSIGSAGGNQMSEVISNSLSHGRVATVLPGVIPVESTEITASYLWLAYASVPYFKGRTNNLVSPIYGMGMATVDDPRFLLPGRWKFTETRPELVHELVIFHDGFIRMRSRTGGIDLMPYPEPFDKGFTNAIYAVEEWGEVGGLHLPQKFRFEKFLPHGTPQSPSNLTMYVRISGQATILSPGATSKKMLPTLPERTPVVDRRLPPKTNAVPAHATNRLHQPRSYPTYSSSEKDGWLSEEQALARIAAKSQPPKPKTNPLAYVVVVAVAVLPVILFLWKRRRRKE